MWFVVLVVSFLIGVFSFNMFLGSIFAGMLVAIKANIKKLQARYLGSILIHSVFIIIAIVLMCSSLNKYWSAILVGYFCIPFVIFIFTYSGYFNEAKQEAMSYLETEIKDYFNDENVPQEDKEKLLKIFLNDELTEEERDILRKQYSNNIMDKYINSEVQNQENNEIADNDEYYEDTEDDEIEEDEDKFEFEDDDFEIDGYVYDDGLITDEEDDKK